MQYSKLINNYLFYFSLVLIYMFGGDVSASPLAIVVQGANITPYNNVFKGIKEAYGQQDIERIILYDYKGDILKCIKDKSPSIIFAIGKWAFSKVSHIDDIPIIYLMVLDPDPSITKKKNVAGISMLVSEENNISFIKKYIPSAKRLGIIYNPRYSWRICKGLLDAAKKYHMLIVVRKASSSRDVFYAINSISNSIDVFVMIPDLSLITPETVHFMSLFFLKRSIPVVTFSEKYLDMGAFMAIYPDPYDMGLQAGELAKKIIHKKIRLPVMLWPRKNIIKLNPRIKGKLGLNMYTKSRPKAKLDAINP